MGILLIGGISIGAKEVARWRYLAESFTDEWALGVAAAVAAITVALCSLLLGRHLDRRDPRPFVVLAMGIAGLGNFVTGMTLLQGPLSLGNVIIAAVFDGAGIGIGGVSLLKMQAALVRPGAEGAAEILNILRLGIGGVAGALLASVSPSPTVTLLCVSAVVGAATIALVFVLRGVRPRQSNANSRRERTSLLTYLRANPVLSRIVSLDLALALVIPTQLVNLVLFNQEADEVAALSIAAGVVGVLIGRLALTILGFRGNPRSILFATTLCLSSLQILGAFSLTDGWILGQPLALPLIVIFGSICSTYAQGLLAAIIQQEVVEQHRGSLGSILVAGRYILISAGAILGTLAAATLGSQAFVLLLGLLLLVVILGTRGFAVLSVRSRTHVKLTS